MSPTSKPVTFNLNPKAHRITSDAEAIRIARELAADFAVGAAERDRERRLPVAELDRFSESGLWALTVPKAYGGSPTSIETLAEVIATISSADPSIGQIPQNHYATLDALRITGSEEQKHHWYGKVLEGNRLGNAFSEAGGKNVGTFETTLTPDGDGFRINGRKFYATGALFAHIFHIGAVDPNGHLYLGFVPRGTPGISVIDDWSGFGQRTTASGSVVLENVRLEKIGALPAYLGADKPNTSGSLSQIIQAAVDTGIARSAIAATIDFIRTRSRPWIDSGQERAGDDIFTITQIADLEIRLHTAEALLARAARAIDAIYDNPTDESVAETQVKVAEAKVLTTEIAILAGDKLHELGGTRTVLAADNLDRHWRNARTHTLHDPVRWKVFHVGNYALNGVSPPRHPWS